MVTRVDDARSLLEAERDELQSRLEQVNAALAALSNGGGAPAAAQAPKAESASKTRSSSKPKAQRPRGKSKWTKEQLTCPHCGFKASAPQGLAGHIRVRHSAADTSASESSGS